MPDVQQEAAFTTEVMDLIQNADSMTHSDLDGALAAIYYKYCGTK